MKKILIALVLLVMAASAVVGLALFGFIKVPGLKPFLQKGNKAPAIAGRLDPKTVAAKSPAQPPTKPPAPVRNPSPPSTAGATPTATGQPKTVVPTIDAEEGAHALGKIWNEMKTTKLTEILKTWKDPDVAQVFRNMDTDKVAEILDTLPADRAGKISALMQKQASVVSPS